MLTSLAITFLHSQQAHCVWQVTSVYSRTSGTCKNTLCGPTVTLWVEYIKLLTKLYGASEFWFHGWDGRKGQFILNNEQPLQILYVM